MRTLSLLSGATVHELRGAANSVALHLQLLTVEPSTDDVRERQRRSLACLDEARRRLFDLAEVFVRHATRPDPREGPFDLARVASDAVALARPYAATRRVELRLARPDVPATVAGRQDAVLQALVDVLIDLLDGCEQGGALAVTVDATDRDVRVVMQGPAPDAGSMDRFATAVRWAGGIARRTDDGSLVLELPVASPTE